MLFHPILLRSPGGSPQNGARTTGDQGRRGVVRQLDDRKPQKVEP